MGPACEDVCTNGTQVPMNSGNCACDPCFTGRGCNVECTGHGICVGNSCHCDQLTGWRGSLCEVPGCPGSNGKDCSGNGKCDSANHQCICLPGRETRNCGCVIAEGLVWAITLVKTVQYLRNSQVSIGSLSVSNLAGKSSLSCYKGLRVFS